MSKVVARMLYTDTNENTPESYDLGLILNPQEITKSAVMNMVRRQKSSDM